MSAIRHATNVRGDRLVPNAGCDQHPVLSAQLPPDEYAQLVLSLEALGPAGAGRLDTQAKELRGQAQQLRDEVIEARARSDAIVRQAIRGTAKGLGGNTAAGFPTVGAVVGGHVNSGMTWDDPPTGALPRRRLSTTTTAGVFGSFPTESAAGVPPVFAEPDLPQTQAPPQTRGASPCTGFEIKDAMTHVPGASQWQPSTGKQASVQRDAGGFEMPAVEGGQIRDSAQEGAACSVSSPFHFALSASDRQQTPAFERTRANEAENRPGQASASTSSKKTLAGVASAVGGLGARMRSPAFSNAPAPKRISRRSDAAPVSASTRRNTAGPRVRSVSPGSAPQGATVKPSKPSSSASKASQTMAAGARASLRAAGRDVPSPEALKRSFNALMRGRGILISKDVFVDFGHECAELRAVLRTAFGSPILEQDSVGLQEDLAFLFDCLAVKNSTVTGEVSVQHFTKGFYDVLADIPALEPESPRLPPERARQWGALLKAVRHEMADIARLVPLCAVGRLSNMSSRLQNAGAADVAKFTSALAAQKSAVGNIDWKSISRRDLLETVSALAPLGRACIADGANDFVRSALARARAAVCHRLRELGLSSDELVSVVTDLLSAAVSPSSRTESSNPLLDEAAAWEWRILLRAVARQLGDMPAWRLANLACAALEACLSEEVELWEALAIQLREICSAGPIAAKQSLDSCMPDESADLFWALAHYDVCCLQQERTSGPRAPSTAALQSTASCLLESCDFDVARLSNVRLARLSWAMGHLGVGFASSVVGAVAEAFTRNCSALTPSELSQVAYALASLGAQPPELCTCGLLPSVDGLVERLEAHDLVRLVAALSVWPVPADHASIITLLRKLRCQVGNLAADELLLAACATARLAIRDDELMQKLHQRAKLIGPFDARGAANMMQCLDEYWCRWGLERNRQAAAGFAVAATRHGGAQLGFSAPCWKPPALPDVRSERLLNAMKLIIPT